MTCTVLGATGFIGSRLVALLRSRGECVFAPTKGSSEVFTQPLGRVYYCVGMTADYANDPVATFEAHSEFIIRLLANAQFEKILYLSSTRLYDGLRQGQENDPLNLAVTNPRHLFDLTKALGEHFVLLHSNNRGAVARLSSVYDDASDATGFLPDLLARLAQETTFKIDSSPTSTRDYIHIDDVLTALVAIMDRGHTATIYNVAGGQNVSNLEIVETINRFGWQLSLSQPPNPQESSPLINIERIRSLGVVPRSVTTYLKNRFGKIR